MKVMQGCDINHDNDYARKSKSRTGESPLAHTDADEPERVDGGDDKGKPIDSGNWSKASKKRVVDLRDAKLVPGKASDAGAGQFHGDPGERNEKECCLTSEAYAAGGDQRSEESVIETEIQTEENKDARGDGLSQTAIEIHRLVDPVAVTEIPDEAAEITENGSLSQSEWACLSCCCREAPRAAEEARSSRKRFARAA